MLHKQIASLTQYVEESHGDERMFALCVLADFALESGSEKAVCALAQAALNNIGDNAEAVRSAAADFLNDAIRAAPRLKSEAREQIGSRVEKQMDAETIRRVRRKLNRVLVTLGIREQTLSIKNGVKLVAAIASVLSQGSMVAA